MVTSINLSIYEGATGIIYVIAKGIHELYIHYST